jgi:cell division protein FtsZ
MAPLIELEDAQNPAKIKVIGVGGGGGNAINTMIASGLAGVEFIAANTDLQALDANLAAQKVHLGSKTTKGLGAGANPTIGREAALEETSRLTEVLQGSDMVFVTAGMGGGTGTGGAPIIAQVARELGALTVGVVTKPFNFEGRKRMKNADEGIEELQRTVDTLITIPNQRLLSVAGQATTMLDAFRKVDEVLLNAVQGISDLITIHGFINVDFADVRTVMSNTGRALMGTGYAAGDRKALEAAQQAVASPLLEDTTIDGATGILINITGGPDLTLAEINEAATLIQEAAHEDANIIFGSVIDAAMEDQVRITVIATGFDPAIRALAAEHAAAAAARPLAQPQLTTTRRTGSQPAIQRRDYAYAVAEPARAPLTAYQGTPQPPTPALSPSASSPGLAPSTEPDPATHVSQDHQSMLAGLQASPATGTAQTTFPIPEMANAADPSRRGRRPTSGQAPVPRLHPGLQVPDEHEMDVPAFLRRGNHPPTSDS